nr:uncharacterized protein LOC131741594 [Kogia breviceps]
MPASRPPGQRRALWGRGEPPRSAGRGTGKTDPSRREGLGLHPTSSDLTSPRLSCPVKPVLNRLALRAWRLPATPHNELPSRYPGLGRRPAGSPPVQAHDRKKPSYCCRKGGPFQGPRVGACLTLGNELSEETHVLTKQETSLGRGDQAESSSWERETETAHPTPSLYEAPSLAIQKGPRLASSFCLLLLPLQAEEVWKSVPRVMHPLGFGIGCFQTSCPQRRKTICSLGLFESTEMGGTRDISPQAIKGEAKADFSVF